MEDGDLYIFQGGALIRHKEATAEIKLAAEVHEKRAKWIADIGEAARITINAGAARYNARRPLLLQATLLAHIAFFFSISVVAGSASYTVWHYRSQLPPSFDYEFIVLIVLAVLCVCSMVGAAFNLFAYATGCKLRVPDVPQLSDHVFPQPALDPAGYGILWLVASAVECYAFDIPC
jgi:hypothetical protein